MDLVELIRIHVNIVKIKLGYASLDLSENGLDCI
jgi:hypothetical protein